MLDVHSIGILGHQENDSDNLCVVLTMCRPPKYVVSRAVALGLQGHLPIWTRLSRSERESDLPRSQSKVAEAVAHSRASCTSQDAQSLSEKNIFKPMLLLFILDAKAVHSTFEKDSIPMSLNWTLRLGGRTISWIKVYLLAGKCSITGHALKEALTNVLRGYEVCFTEGQLHPSLLSL